MKNALICAIALLGTGIPQNVKAQFQTTFQALSPADRTLFFNTDSTGTSLPILWGLDTAWPSEDNMRRGVSYIGADNIGVARVSFQPWEMVADSTALTPTLEANLRERLRLVSLIKGEGGDRKSVV